MKNANEDHAIETENQEFNLGKEILQIIILIVLAVFAARLINIFVGQRTEVSGPSMYDTLEDGDNLWVNKMAYHFQNPERFDIVIFPHEDEMTDSEYFIKRIIGLPGEKVRIDENGTIYINDEPLEENYGYEVIDADMIERAKNNVVLGADEYFVMGDNRNNSMDSRTEEVGNIKREELVGKAVFRIWPLSKLGKIK